MKLRGKILSVIFLTCLVLCGGCRLLESAASDVQGWDLSACVSGFDTCWELLWDNSEKFEDSFVEAMDELVPKGE